jgi:nucleotide-binding universal stress UspA family protein
MPVIGEAIAVTIKNILLATDFTAASDRASDYALALARRYASSVAIANVYDPTVVVCYEEAILGLPNDEKRDVRKELLDLVRDDFIAAGVEAKALPLDGFRPHVALLEAAREQEADLIVAGTRSKWELERMVLGSTAEELIRNAPCPVITVGPNAKEPKSGPLVFRSIVFATDFSPEAAKAAEYALSFAQDSGAHLYFCYVVSTQIAPHSSESLDASFKLALERLVPPSCREWCSPYCVVEHGDAAQAVLELTRRVGAELIVLGARKSSFWLRHIERGITPNLLAEAACPVMTVC